MKKPLNRRLAAIALAVAAAGGLAVSLASASNQPNMDSALASLRSARTALIEAKSNKGGHRVKAIELVDAAIGEVKRGIEAGE